jgi:hypothetical protein
MENSEIKSLKNQINRLQLGLLCCVTLTLVVVLSGFTVHEQKFDIIRAKGIIIEDSSGRDRILIGAPIPQSAHRVRTDTAAVRKHFAQKFGNPNQYMKWYKDYKHSAIGMIVMNEAGFDRVQIGDELADPNIGQRMFEAAGIMWNDKEGWERGGAGVNTLEDGRSRSVVGLDDDSGEAVHLVAVEDGTKGLMIAGKNGHLLIGMSNPDGHWFKNKEAFTGIKYFDRKGTLLWEKEMKADHQE